MTTETDLQLDIHQLAPEALSPAIVGDVIYFGGESSETETSIK